MGTLQNSTPIVTTITNYTITNLTASTAYKVKVVDNGNQVPHCKPIEILFSTLAVQYNSSKQWFVGFLLQTLGEAGYYPGLFFFTIFTKKILKTYEQFKTKSNRITKSGKSILLICADRLNITESQYIKLKKEVLSRKKEKKEKKVQFFSKAADNAQIVEAIDLEKGEGKISGTFDHEPKSAEEIIQLLKIDTNKWKLSQYWNKQMGDHWRVSALVSQIKNSEEKLFKNLLESWKPKKYKSYQKFKF